MFEPLKNRLADHFEDAEFIGDGQVVGVGVRPSVEGPGSVAILKVENCHDQLQAEWIAGRVSTDVKQYLEFVNQEAVPLDMIGLYCWFQDDGEGWTASVGVELIDRESAEAFAEALTAYAKPDQIDSVH